MRFSFTRVLRGSLGVGVGLDTYHNRRGEEKGIIEILELSYSWQKLAQRKDHEAHPVLYILISTHESSILRFIIPSVVVINQIYSFPHKNPVKNVRSFLTEGT
jgi:hypothetical protein